MSPKVGNELNKVIIVKIERFLPDEITELVSESIDEGFLHIKRLVDDYQNGINKFDKQGEAFFIAYLDDRIVGVCGLNQDPYAAIDTVGRVRRLYVSKAFRRFGVGRLLMNEVVEEARKHFKTLVLRTDNPVADKLYRAFGFCAKKETEHSTHELRLS